MVDMLREQPWFLFDLPGGPGVSFVPAASEEQARRQMQETAYPKATWPYEVACIGSRFCSRAALHVQSEEREGK